MTAEDPNDGTEANRAHEDWPFEDDRPDDAQYVGTSQAGGNAWFYSESSDNLFGREVDESDRLLPASDERTVREGESLGEAVERLGDELGWESLSAFARKHLEGGEGSGGDGTAGGEKLGDDDRPDGSHRKG